MVRNVRELQLRSVFVMSNNVLELLKIKMYLILVKMEVYLKSITETYVT